MASAEGQAEEQSFLNNDGGEAVAEVELTEVKTDLEGASPAAQDEDADENESSKLVEGEGESGGDSRSVGFSIHLDVSDEGYDSKRLYQVAVASKPAGFFFENDIIMLVNEFGSSAGKIIPMSKVVQVNNEPVTADTFAEVYRATQAPLTLHLVPPTGAVSAAGADGGGPKTLSKGDLLSLLVVYAAVLIDWIAALIVLPLLPFLAVELKINSAELSLLFSGYSIGSIFGGLIIGQVTQRWGTKAGIIYSMGGTCITLLFCGLYPTFTTLLLMRIAGGLTGNSIPVAMIFIGLRVPAPLRPRYMSYVSVLLTIAFIISPLVGGSLSVYSLSIPFYFGSATAGLGVIATLVGMKNELPPHKPKGGKSPPLVPANFWSFALALLQGLSYSAVLTMIGPYLITQFQVKSNDLGMILSGQYLVVSLASIFAFPAFVKLIGLYKTYMLGCSCLIIGFSVVGMATTWYSTMAVIAFLVGSGFSFMQNTATPILDFWATPQTKATVMSVGQALAMVGFAVGPIIWGALLDYCTSNNMTHLFWLGPALCTLMPLLTILISYCVTFKPQLAKRQADAARKREREAEHEMQWRDCEPTEADYAALGQRVGQMLTERHVNWVEHQPEVEGLLKRFIPPMPTRSPEAHMRGIWYLLAQAERSEQEWAEYAETKGLLDGDDGVVAPANATQ